LAEEFFREAEISFMPLVNRKAYSNPDLDKMKEFLFQNVC
jgi:hypothetical protein